MKNFKFLKYSLLSVLVLLGSCQEFKIDSQDEYPDLVNENLLDNYNVSASNPQSIMFNINANVPWKIVTDQQWCHISTSSSGESSLIEDITISFDENTDTESRKATIKIFMVGNEVPVSETVIEQEGKTSLKIKDGENFIQADGGDFKFTITSNKSWSITTDKTWLTISPESGDAGTDIEITAHADNNVSAKRTASVFISAAGEEKSINITQGGFTLEFVQPEDLNVPSGGGEKEIDVNTTISSDFEVTTETDGVGIDCDQELKKVKVSIPANPVFAKRKIVLNLSAKNAVSGMEPSVLELGQDVNFNFLAVPELYDINQETASVKLKKGGTDGTSTANVYVETKDTYGYGTFTWTFDGANIQSPYWFEIHGQDFINNIASPNIKIQFPKQDNNNAIAILANGFVSWAAPKTFNGYGFNQLNAIKEFKMVISPSVTSGKLKIELYYNGSLVGIDETRGDIFAGEEGKKLGYRCAINNQKAGTADITIKSFTYEPLNQ